MDRKKFLILVAVLSMILLLLIVKIVYKANLNQNVIGQNINISANENFTENFEKVKTSGKPALIVISFESNCCENTKKFLP